MDDVNIWLLLAAFAMAIAWAWEMAEVMAIKTRRRYKEEAREEGNVNNTKAAGIMKKNQE